VPLESRQDFLTLATGKKIQVPFEQLIIFSTNLEPNDLADEAFLRRIGYKIEVTDPSLAEFATLFEAVCQSFGCRFVPDAVHYLVQTHYRPHGRALRRCHARDLLSQIKNYCTYHGKPMELRPDYIDRVVKSYFTSAEVKHSASPPASVEGSNDFGFRISDCGLKSSSESAIRNPQSAIKKPPLRLGLAKGNSQ
jgi:hypothetical protein